MAPRVLLVYGSQTGNTRGIAQGISEKLQEDVKFETFEVMDGNTLAHETEELDSIVPLYDVLLVCTSSFGKGDPPHNYNQFLAKIMNAAEGGGKPLKGMQHAVLGEGSSVYKKSFQNCPRLTDKYLEQLGSRRLVPRHEIDVGGSEPESVGRDLWRDAVLEQLRSLPDPMSAPIHKWEKPRVSHSQPVEQIVSKTREELNTGAEGQTWAQIIVPLVAISCATGIALYFTYAE